jgi:hypothetical protein
MFNHDHVHGGYMAKPINGVGRGEIQALIYMKGYLDHLFDDQLHDEHAT